jgi:hypothetical protein
MGMPGMPGESPMEMPEWETSLDAYSGLVDALRSHTNQINSVLEQKHDEIDTTLMNIRWRLSNLAANKNNTKSLTKHHIEDLKGLLKAAGMTEQQAVHMHRIRKSDVTEAEKLEAVAIDTMVARRQCQDCKNAAVASLSSLRLLMTLVTALLFLF